MTSIDNATNFVEARKQEVLEKLMPAIQEVGEMCQKHREEFYELFRQQAIENLGCEAECINECTSQEYMDFWELPKCVMWCPCYQGPITLEDGRMNYPALLKTYKSEKYAWSLFKRMQNKI